MKKVTVLVVMLLVAVAWAQQPKAGGKTKTEVVGVSVAKADPNDKFGRSQARSLNPGTGVFVRITAPERSFLSLHKESCKLDSFTDDKGTVLAKPGAARRWGSSWLGSFPNFSEDGHACIIRIQSKKTPATGAGALKLKASIAILCGSDQKTVEQKDVALKADTKITVSPVPMKVKSVNPDPSGGEKVKMSVELGGKTSKAELAKIKSVAFFGADGKEIGCTNMGSGTMGMGESVNYERTYGLHKKIEKVTIKITYFQKVEKVLVPIDVSVGVGL